MSDFYSSILNLHQTNEEINPGLNYHKFMIVYRQYIARYASHSLAEDSEC